MKGTGMLSIDVPMGMSRDGLKEKVDRVVALMADPEAEMRAFGFNDIWVNFRQFIRNYAEDMKR